MTLGVHAMLLLPDMWPEGLPQGIVNGGHPHVFRRTLEERPKSCNSLPWAVGHVEIGGRQTHHNPEANIMSNIQ